MEDGPLQLLGRDQNLAEEAVNLRLARVQTSGRSDDLLVIQYVPARIGGQQASPPPSRAKARTPNLSSVFRTLRLWPKEVLAHCP